MPRRRHQNVISTSGMAILCFTGWAGVPNTMAYEKIYERTPVGIVEVKEVPERVALEASTGNSYFDEDNGLFMKLFNYIQENDIAMTVPVEAEIEPGTMRFFVGPKNDAGQALANDTVGVYQLPARNVISLGLRGAYTREKYEQGLITLRDWLATNDTWRVSEQAYMVYWNGPFVPRWFKRSEIHLPIEPNTPAETGTNL